MYDAIVVGLGPAGATAAHSLADAGHKVLGIDRETFPRYKSCGGCMSTKVERVLGFDISEVVEETVFGATFTYRSGRPIDIISDRVVGYNVMRDRFDHFLLKRARSAGAEVVEGLRVRGVEQNGESVTVWCEDGRSFKARFLIGCDGAAGMTGRECFGLKARECAVSITAEVPYDREAREDCNGRLFIDFGGVPFGYAWIFPKKDYLSVGIAGDTAKVGGGIKDHFSSFVNTHAALEGVEVTERVGWSVPIFYGGATKLVKGRVLLAGDTGHLVDPFLGEGIYYAIRTGSRAARAVSNCLKAGGAEPQEYQDWLTEEIFPEFESADRLSDLIYNHPRLWYSILEKDPGIMLGYYDVIRGEWDCKGFYDWVNAKVRSKPWKILRRWIDSRFLPS